MVCVIEKALKRTFSPEFLNRVDDVIIFNSLEKHHIFEIIDILHFFMNMAISIGMTPQEMYNMYMSKNQENRRRQQNNY